MARPRWLSCRARQLAEQLDDTDAFVDLCSFQGALVMSNRDRAKFESGFAIVEEGLDVARRAGLIVPAARASRALAARHFYDGRFAQAERALDTAIAELARVDDPERPSDLALGARTMRDRIAYHRDDTVAALAGAAVTYNTAVRVGNRTLQIVSAATLAQAHLVRGEYAAAQRWAEQSLGVALAIGNFGATRSPAAIGLIVCLQVGDSSPTARYLELLDCDPTGNLEPLSSAIVIEALLAAEAVERAEHYAETAYASAGGHLREAVAALALGDVRLRGSAARLPEAYEWYDRALRLADDLGLRSIAAGAMLGLGELAAARGDRVTAIRFFCSEQLANGSTKANVRVRTLCYAAPAKRPLERTINRVAN